MNQWNCLSQEQQLLRIRHSLAHILAQAVLEMRPGSKLGFGPPIEDGLYYDFILSSPLSESDFPEIEKKMKKIISEDVPFIQEELPLLDAYARLHEMGEPYKKEYAQEIVQKHLLQSLSFYRSGGFVDMCEGPHVERSSQIPQDCFKIRNIAGAYWRGDSSNRMMSRIYVWAFENQSVLQAHLEAYELGLKRDHKKLGKEFEIFMIDEEVGKGLPLWLPHGAVIRDELEALMKELEFKAGYRKVSTPHLAKRQLYRKTGHLPYYEEGMYPPMNMPDSDEVYYLRPMNCPHHHKIYASKPRSYRELPIRLSEYGQVYRYEDSGALSGLLRVRGMCQNDAHIYCREDQVEAEILRVLDLYKRAYQILGIRNYQLRLSKWDPEAAKGGQKYISNPKLWNQYEALLRKILYQAGLPFYEKEGEAAFYGPKIDMQLKSVTGREESISTIQIDFTMAERLNLSYIGSDHQEHPPIIIHRAPLGSHERMVAFLLEAYGGDLPLWLSPIQVRVLPVSEKFQDYAIQVVEFLREHLIRAEIDDSSETLSKRIRNANQMRIPNLLILGDRERSKNEVTLRKRGGAEQSSISLDSFVHVLLRQIQQRMDDHEKLE